PATRWSPTSRSAWTLRPRWPRHTRARARSRSASGENARRSPTSWYIPSLEALHVHAGRARDPRVAGEDRGRPRDPARGADARVVLHRRRSRARARRVPARRGAAAGAGTAAAVGARLLRLRGARQERPRGHRPGRGRARVVRDPGLLLLEPGGDLRAGRGDP